MELHKLLLASQGAGLRGLSLYSAAEALLASLSPHGSPADQAAVLLDLLLALLGQPGGPELLAARGAFNAVSAACTWSLVGAGRDAGSCACAVCGCSRRLWGVGAGTQSWQIGGPPDGARTLPRHHRPSR